jgi:D-sorbitol dehydrogenase (acceptor)
MKLEGRVALVTGGARGIGEAIVDRFVAEGAPVAIGDIATPSPTRIAKRHRENAFGVELDALALASIERG